MSARSNQLPPKERDDLETRRVDLLQKLHESDLVVGDRRSAHAESSHLTDYNAFVEALAAQRPSPHPDPIKLPVEIFIAIIKEAVGYDDATSMEAVLRLTLLSDHWRVALLQIPDLWVEISIENRYVYSPELPAQIHLGTTLTLHRPITLAIDHILYNWENILPLIRPHTHRIRRILVRSPPVDECVSPRTAPSKRFDDVISSLGSLPILQDLTVFGDQITSPDEWSFLANMPSIRCISETRAPFDRLVTNPNILPHLYDLYSHVTASELLKYRSQLRHLEYLSSTQRYILEGYNITEENVEFDLRHIDDPSETFTLRGLDYQLTTHKGLPELIHRSPHLVRLHMYISWKFLAGILPHLSALPSLEILSFSIMSSTSDDLCQFRPIGLPIVLPIYEFRIRAHWEDFQSTTDTVPQRLETIYQHLDPLTLQRLFIFYHDVQEELPLSHINRFQKVKYLSIELINVPHLGCPNPLSLPLLEDLLLTMPPETHNEILREMQCPRIMYISLDRGDYEMSTPMVVSESSVKGLDSLRWRVEHLRWEVTSLSHLRTLSLRTVNSLRCGDFCVHMICRPEDFPALIEIDFGSFPEWDLLVLFLERRNFLANSKVTMVRELTLPTFVGPVLAYTLTELLKGRLSLRPSNEELSFASLADSYWDSSCLGCHYCLITHHYCSTEPLSWGLYRENWLDPVQIRTPEPPLPRAVELWLEGRISRLRRWDVMETEAVFARVRACTKHFVDYTCAFTELSGFEPRMMDSCALRAWRNSRARK